MSDTPPTLQEQLEAGERRALRIIETLERLRAKRQEVEHRRQSAIPCADYHPWGGIL